MSHGYVISDLHLFAERSIADDHLTRMRKAAAEADFFVLNGDVFDFRWAGHGSLDTSVDAAVDWLVGLAEAFPKCQFYYIMGNHDGLRPLAERVDRAVNDVPNLEWDPTHYRLGAALFLHGDLAMSREGGDITHRVYEETVRSKGRVLNCFYNLLVNVGLHTLTALVHTPSFCARRIYRSLLRAPEALREGVTDVYFGHTHTAFSDFRYGGINFHNTGAAIRGLECRIMRVRPAP